MGIGIPHKVYLGSAIRGKGRIGEVGLGRKDDIN
jgi:hypothetical protein